MKTTIGILALVLAIISFAMPDNTKAQFLGPQSDTIIFPHGDSLTNGNNPLRDFGTISKGQSECHTIYIKNTLSAPLIIQGISQENNSGYYGEFTVKAIPTLPTILLQNEIVSIADICLAPVNPTTESVSGNLIVTGTSGSKSVYLSASFKGKEVVDPVLQKNCDSLSLDADFFGPIIMDGDITQTATIESNRYDTMQVTMDTAVYGDGSVFHISGITFPYMLAPREVKHFNITFSPRSNTPIVKYRYVGLLSLQVITGTTDSNGNRHYWNECDFPKLTLAGVAIPPTADSVSTSLAAGSTDVLAMISDNQVTTQTFHFTNNGITNLKITAVDLKNKKSFAITDIQPTMTLPFVLTPGQSMSVTVAMTTVTNGVYYDEVIITAENAFISMEFPLQGLRKNGVLGVKNIADDQHLLLYPNPSHGEITVEIPGIQNAKIEVLDLLGRVVATDVASEKWVWKSNQTSGTYILQVKGIDKSGKSFQSYDRFIIE